VDQIVQSAILGVQAVHQGLALPILLPLPFIDLLDNIANSVNLKLQYVRNELNFGFNCMEIPPHQPAVEN
tara:strand:- start:1062 stop:1271 length:210 start_codon:yes stop_codon:yes gene_type:complete